MDDLNIIDEEPTVNVCVWCDSHQTIYVGEDTWSCGECGRQFDGDAPDKDM